MADSKKAENVVNEITATETIEKWLDHKKVRAGKRKAYSQSIDTLVTAVEDGELALDEKNFSLVYKLRHPLENEITTDRLVFKPKTTSKDIRRKTKGISPTDIEGRTAAYVSALTGQPINLIEELDTEDNDICSAIAVFFM